MHFPGRNLTMRKLLAASVLLGLWSLSAQAQFCGQSLQQSLVAHGNIPAGTVTVSNDGTNLYVAFATAGDFTMLRADVAVATSLAGIPQSGGQPNLSAFPYRQAFSPEVTTYTFTIPLASIPATANTSVVIAAHASLDSPSQGHQQAWANPGQLFPCSQACSTGGGCGGDGDGDDNGDHAHRVRPSDGNGGDDDCHGEGDGGDGASIGKRARIRLFDDGHGGTGQCGGGGDDDHGDGQGVSPLWGGGDGGGDQSGCGGGDHHGDHQHSGVSPQDGGGDGGDEHHHKDGGSDCQAGCGAVYFSYVVQRCLHE
jgi:hypothetical protein